jgi:hypothetical protein
LNKKTNKRKSKKSYLVGKLTERSTMDCELATRQIGVSWAAKKAVMVGRNGSGGSGSGGGVKGEDTAVVVAAAEGGDFAAMYDDEEVFPCGPPPAALSTWVDMPPGHSLDSLVNSLARGQSKSSSVSFLGVGEDMLMPGLQSLPDGGYDAFDLDMFSSADGQQPEYPEAFDDMFLSTDGGDVESDIGLLDDGELSLGWRDEELSMFREGDSDLYVCVKDEAVAGLKKRALDARDAADNEPPAQRRRLSPVDETPKTLSQQAVAPKAAGAAGASSPVAGLEHLGDALCHKRTWETVQGVPRLEVVLQPLDRFYKDEGGANNFLICHVQLHGSVSESLFDGAKSPDNLLTNSVPLDCHVETEDGTKLGVADQAYLKLMSEPRLGLSRLHGELKFRLERTSKNYSGKKLRVHVSLRGCPAVRATSTSAIKVLSKRKKLKAEVRNKLTEQALNAHVKNVVN